MNGVGIKEEIPTFKSEMDTYPAASLDDDDGYEDTGELNIPPNIESLWLTRVPDYLWAALSRLNDDDEIQIGTVRIWGEQGSQKVELQ